MGILQLVVRFGNGFAIVTKHNNLNESDLYIGKDKKSPIAKEDWMGSAVIPSITNYRPDNIIYDVDNLPPGYDLGAGKFYLSPKYKSGYVLKVGTDYTVMTLGNLVDASGKPISLIGGEASIEGEKDSKKVTVFTNSSGRFAAQGLKPWKVAYQYANQASIKVRPEYSRWNSRTISCRRLETRRSR